MILQCYNNKWWVKLASMRCDPGKSHSAMWSSVWSIRRLPYRVLLVGEDSNPCQPTNPYRLGSVIQRPSQNPDHWGWGVVSMPGREAIDIILTSLVCTVTPVCKPSLPRSTVSAVFNYATNLFAEIAHFSVNFIEIWNWSYWGRFCNMHKPIPWIWTPTATWDAVVLYLPESNDGRRERFEIRFYLIVLQNAHAAVNIIGSWRAKTVLNANQTFREMFASLVKMFGTSPNPTVAFTQAGPSSNVSFDDNVNCCILNFQALIQALVRSDHDVLVKIVFAASLFSAWYSGIVLEMSETSSDKCNKYRQSLVE